MSEKIDWPSMIGRRVSGVSRGTETKVQGTLEAFGYDRSGQYWVIREGNGEDGYRDWLRTSPALLPEWEPKDGKWSWYGGAGDSFEEGWITVFNKDMAKDWETVRPLTDDEIIDIGKGIANLRRIVQSKYAGYDA